MPLGRPRDLCPSVSAGPDAAWNTNDHPVLNIYHGSVTDFRPNWQYGALTAGLAALTGQLEPPV